MNYLIPRDVHSFQTKALNVLQGCALYKCIKIHLIVIKVCKHKMSPLWYKKENYKFGTFISDCV